MMLIPQNGYNIHGILGGRATLAEELGRRVGILEGRMENYEVLK
jgi:hypothetical protein